MPQHLAQTLGVHRVTAPQDPRLPERVEEVLRGEFHVSVSPPEITGASREGDMDTS